MIETPKTAIDVVLLPSSEMTTKVIEINRELLKTAEHKIILDDRTCLPHISLCMGVIEDANLPEAKRILTEVTQGFTVFELTAENLRPDVILTGETVFGLRIKTTEVLQKLQTMVMDRLWPYLSYNVDANMLYNPSEIEDVTLTWIKGYAKKHDDPSLFSPHMTVGFGETNAFAGDFPMQFDAPVLALGQLGNYCTFRKVLERLELPRTVAS